MSNLHPESGHTDVVDVPNDTWKDDLFVDPTGEVKSHTAQNGEPRLPPSENDGQPESLVESPDALHEVSAFKLVQEQQADQLLQTTKDTLSQFQLLMLEPALSDEQKTILSAMYSDLERKLAEIRYDILDAKDIGDRIEELKQDIKNQIAVGEAWLREAEKTKAAAAAGYATVARYEAAKGVKNTSQTPTSGSETGRISPSASPRTSELVPSKEETNTLAKKVSDAERKLGSKYSRVAGLISELQQGSRHRNDPEHPDMVALRDKAKHFQDLAMRQFEGAGRKPKLIGGMKEIDAIIKQAEDALFARQQSISPSSDKESKKRFAKFEKSKHKNKFARFM